MLISRYVKALAWLGIGVYACGLLVMNAALLFGSRRAITKGPSAGTL
jgi:hypothetical protein